MKFFGKYIILFAAAASLFSDCPRSSFAECLAEVDDIASITVTADGKSFTYTDERITPSDFTVAEEIEKRMINAPLARKIECVDTYLSKGADYKTAVLNCFPLLERFCDGINEYLYIAPVDAEVEYSDGKFHVTHEKIGRALDERRLYADIYCTFKFAGSGSVKASTLTLEPKITRDELERGLIMRGSYTTSYSTSTSSRAHNIALALSKFGGISIASGETLSFNATVGERTEANGFEKAKIILDGKYVDGVGGGVCQASTALYNAALAAGLDCVANAHSICPSYCAAGLDAMISTASDLTVTNNTGATVYIATQTHGYESTVRIFGAEPEYRIEPESVTLKTVEFETHEITDTDGKYFDASAVSGERILVSLGKDGVESETYLKYYKNGAFVKRVRIRTNKYKALDRVIAVAP